jgi:hypothetical protein
MSGVKALRNELIEVALVLAFAGLITHVCYALLRRDGGLSDARPSGIHLDLNHLA